jgi:hypothetical protein
LQSLQLRREGSIARPAASTTSQANVSAQRLVPVAQCSGKHRRCVVSGLNEELVEELVIGVERLALRSFEDLANAIDGAAQAAR